MLSNYTRKQARFFSSRRFLQCSREILFALSCIALSVIGKLRPQNGLLKNRALLTCPLAGQPILGQNSFSRFIVPPTEIGWAKPLSMHNEPVSANFAFVNVQPRLNVVIPGEFAALLEVQRGCFVLPRPKFGHFASVSRNFGTVFKVIFCILPPVSFTFRIAETSGRLPYIPGFN
jgi:hypothetical protein